MTLLLVDMQLWISFNAVKYNVVVQGLQNNEFDKPFESTNLPKHNLQSCIMVCVYLCNLKHLGKFPACVGQS